MTETQDVPPRENDGDTSITKPDPSTPAPSSHHHKHHHEPPTAQTLRAWLPLYLKHTDRTLSHLTRILATRSGTDSLLCAIQYSALATSSLLAAVSLRHLQSHVLQLLSSARRALPAAHTTIVLTAAAPDGLLRLSQSLKALSALVSDARTFGRLWGLLGIYNWARGLAATRAAAAAAERDGNAGIGGASRDGVLEAIAWAQVLVNITYQALENGAYLASKGVLLGWDARAQGQAWLWSSRFWAAHVGLEFGRLGWLWRVRDRERRERAEGKRKESETEADTGTMAGTTTTTTTGTGSGALALTLGDDEESRAWRRDLVCNAAYAPLTVHWSLEQGLVGDFWIGALGTVASGVGLARVWKNTA